MWLRKKEKMLKRFVRFHSANKTDNYNRVGGKGKYTDSECIPYREPTRLALGLNMGKTEQSRMSSFTKMVTPFTRWRILKKEQDYHFSMSKFHAPT